jgi:glycerophosphoryl diester phosphodiesterase
MKWPLEFLILFIITISGCHKNTDKPNILVYGHAGTSLHRDRAVYPANSFESIQYAIETLNADGVEIDIQMTKDSILVLYHDAYLEHASNFTGCINEYNYEELKYLKLDYTNYEISLLKDVINYLYSVRKRAYLDVKTTLSCTNTKLSASTFEWALNQALWGVDSVYINENIIVGSTNDVFLNQLTFQNKCYETTNVQEGINKLKTNNYKALLFFDQFVNEPEAKVLNANTINWGIIGVKSKWEIDREVILNPKYIISDNIARTKKVVN